MRLAQVLTGLELYLESGLKRKQRKARCMVHSRVSMTRPERHNREAMALYTDEVKRIMIDVEKKALMLWRRRASDSGNCKLRRRWRVPVALPPKPKLSIQSSERCAS